MKKRASFWSQPSGGCAPHRGSRPRPRKRSTTPHIMDFTKIYTFLSRVWEQSLRDYALSGHRQGE